jgi:hypothetical protein
MEGKGRGLLPRMGDCVGWVDGEERRWLLAFDGMFLSLTVLRECDCDRDNELCTRMLRYDAIVYYQTSGRVSEFTPPLHRQLAAMGSELCEYSELGQRLWTWTQAKTEGWEI